MLDELFSHLDNLGHAARLVGLLGVERVCEHLKANFLIWQNQPWADEYSILMAGWCPLLIHYLTSIGGEHENAAVSQLLEYVLDNRWPQGEHYEALQQAFSSSEIIADEDSPISQLPSFVDEDMVSLAIDSDVNRDLLNGLLQELPDHSASFSRAVARLVEDRSVRFKHSGHVHLAVVTDAVAPLRDQVVDRDPFAVGQDQPRNDFFAVVFADDAND